MATIQFGQYPQSEVTKEQSAYEILEHATGWDEGNEIQIDGIKYRRMKSSDATFKYNYTGYEEYKRKPRHYYWEEDNTWHYFRYEPIKWQVLRNVGRFTKKIQLISDIVLDCRPFHDTEKKVLWYDSTLRS